MKKKLVSALMCATMAVTMLAGCGNGSKNGTEAADGGTEAAESKVVTNTYGDSKGTHLEMWTFVELHAQHYGTRQSRLHVLHIHMLICIQSFLHHLRPVQEHLISAMLRLDSSLT